MDFNGTFLATIITFIVFVFVMNKILYEPILGIMEKRKNFIASNYKEAQDNKDKSEQLADERNEKLAVARDEARVKYSETIDGFKAERTEKIGAAQAEMQEEISRSEEELKHISDEVKDALKGSMTSLASDIVEKVIGYRSEVQEFDNDVVSSVLWGDK